MEAVYFLIVGFLLILAVFDLFVGVSNDAVNFLNSAMGAKVARFRTILVVASLGVFLGALSSAGMLDVARHGIMHPQNYTFNEVMIVFLAVMVSDVIILDVFNTMGMPTSTTVSLIFELLGGAFVLSLIKISHNPSLSVSSLLNSDKALTVILAIFVSVAIAFLCGILVQWISRVVFGFGKQKNPIARILFGAISFCVLIYFIFIKALHNSPWLDASLKTWIADNTPLLILCVFVLSSLLSALMVRKNKNIFRLIILTGTFALAMAFAGNDLVNFIGVPLAGLSSFQDWLSAGAPSPNSFYMVSLSKSASSPLVYLLLAGAIMIVAMCFSRKSLNVIKTSVDLSRQDEGEEMFGSSRAARSIVRSMQECGDFLSRYIPKGWSKAVDKRFDKEELVLSPGAAFDTIRAAVNLVLASVLIVIGTNYKLPLSTTYVIFMVAMGTSLADRAWGRESAVFRVTGVLSVIGGWFVTAGVAFLACALVCLIMYFGGFVAMFILMILTISLIVRSNLRYNKKEKAEKDDTFQLMMRSRDPEIVWDLLRNHISRTQSEVCRFVSEQYNLILEGLAEQNIKELRTIRRTLSSEQEKLQKIRRREFLALRRIPKEIAIEYNTWFHLGANSNQQFVYCLKRMLEPIKEHVDNNFNPLPIPYLKEFYPIQIRIDRLLQGSCKMLSQGDYNRYDELIEQADFCKNELSNIRKQLIDAMQSGTNTSSYKISLVYLNLLQESQELLSIMKHQLRAGQKLIRTENFFFMNNNNAEE